MKAEGQRRLKGFGKADKFAKRKYVDSECDLAESSLLKDCKFTWDVVQSKD